MTYFPQTLPLIAMLAICLPKYIALGQEGLAARVDELMPAGNCSCVFADDKASFLYSSTTPPGDAAKHVDWQVNWSLAAGTRTITRGSSKAIVPADSDVSLYLVEIPMPPLRGGVVLPVQLRMTWIAGGRKYQHNRPLYIFSRNVFAARQAFLETAQIKLFDLDGKTAELLEENEIPHTWLRNVAAIDFATEGIVLVGEGVSFRKQRKLAESLLRAAQRGVPVLCLAPSEGDIPLSIRPLSIRPLAQWQDDQPARPSRLALEREDVVRRYDKRFDEIPTVCHLSLESGRHEVVISAASGPDGWSWLSMEFPPQSPSIPAGRLIVCGLSIVSHWDASPVPRYLFAHLLQELVESSSTAERQKNGFIQE